MIASMLLNQVIEVKTGSFTGNTGVATAIMADGRTLEVKFDGGRTVFLDASFVREVRAGRRFGMDLTQDRGGLKNAATEKKI